MELRINMVITRTEDLALLDEVLKRVGGKIGVEVQTDLEVAPVQQSNTTPVVPTQTVVPPVQQVSTVSPVQAAVVPNAQPQQSTPVTQPVGQTVPTNNISYTIEDLQKAAAPIAQAGRIAELQGVLQSFNVVTIIDLPKEQYGAFALKLRELGAAI